MKLNADTLRAFLAPRGGMLIDAHLIEQVADLMHDTALFIKDAAGRYVVVNQSIVEWHGLTRKSQILGRRPCDVCPGEYGRVPTEQDAHVLRTGRPIVERLELFWHRPHALVWGLTSKFPIRDEAGWVTGLIGISKELSAPLKREEVAPEIAGVLHQLEAHYDRPFTPSSLARMAQMTPVQFARAIRRIYGISPVQLITKTRITAGARLLRETRRRVADIALDCGFTDHSAFTRAFRAVTGMSPTEHRQMNCSESLQRRV